MGIEQRMVIDAISTTSDGRCALTILDHLSWDDEKHLEMLQDKLNDYLDFITSGQLFESRPDANGRELEIKLVCQFDPQIASAARFLETVRATLQRANIHFSCTVLPKDSN